MYFDHILFYYIKIGDGIFDRLTSEEVSKAIWSTLQNKFNN